MIEVDPRELVKAMNGMEAQFPFAVSKALNECAVAFQGDERAVIQREMIVRRPWVLAGVKIDRQDFATKSKLEVRIHIARDRDFLNKFEAGGIRSPRAGKKGLSVPLAARKDPMSLIPRGLRPKALQFQALATRGGTRILKGANGTFLIQKADGSGVILQRKGRAVAVKKRQQGPLMKGQQRDHALVTLFVLRPRTPVPADLHFHETARKSFAAHWPQAMTKWWNESVRTARTGAPIAQGMALPAGWTE